MSPGEAFKPQVVTKPAPYTVYSDVFCLNPYARKFLSFDRFPFVTPPSSLFIF